MSGGVDSSVTALLLKKKGYDVVGVFMKCWTSSNTRINADFNADKRGNFSDECETEREAEDARRVAGKLGIPFYVWDFEEEYKKKVVDYMVEGYRNGLTPNPDVMCNKEIKFGLFLEKALKFGADYVATGHYVRLRRTRNPNLRMHPNDTNKKIKTIRDIRVNSDFSDRFSLYAAKDKNKDQSYFLWTLNQKQLKHCLFPIGDYQKSEVRAIAKKAGLSTAEKKDSQGICFLGKVTLADFLGSYLPARKGAVLNAAGKVIGKHSGAHFFTIGQRHGLASGDWKRTPGASKPFYVSEKNVRENIIVVAEGEDDESLFRKEVKLTDINFINQELSSLISARGGQARLPAEATSEGGNKGYKVLARVRYRQPVFKATLIYTDNTQIGAEKLLRKSASSPRRSAMLVFEHRQKFVAAGQSAVFYLPAIARPGRAKECEKSFRMLGGGIIL